MDLTDKTPSSRRTLFLGALLLSLCAPPTAAQFVWSGGTGNWSAAGNWVGGSIPGTSAIVQIDNGNQLTSVVTVDTNSTIAAFATSPGDSLIVQDGRTLTVQGTSAAFSSTIAGTLTLNGSYYGATLRVAGGTLTLDGGGTLTLSNHANNVLGGAAATDRLVNQDNLIQGSGNIGGNALGLTNRATIAALGSAGLTIDPGPLGMLNTGTVKALGGGQLTLAGGSYTNFEVGTAGLVRAEDSGVVQLSGAAVTGGQVDALGTGEVRFAGSTLTGASLANSPAGILRTTEGTTSFAQVNLNNPAGGQIVLNDGTVLQMSADGTYLNAGTLTLNGSYYGATLRVAGGALTLGGGGTLTFSNHGNNVLGGAAATDRLINQDNLIQGGGRLGDNSLSFTNRGVVRANVSTPLTIDPVAGGDVTNAGTLEATAGATLALQGGTFTNFEGTTLGLIQALDGSQVTVNGATLVGGQLSSTGTGRLRATGGSTLQNNILLAGSVFEVNDGVTVSLVGAPDNRGTISLLGSYYGAGLNVGAGDVTLTGNGTIALSNHPNNLIGGNSTFRLINLSNLIQGSGNIGGNALGLTNRATIAALGSAGLTIDPGALGMLNTGILKALGGGQLTLAGGTYTNFEVGSAGLVRAEDGGVVQLSGAAVTGGQVDALGTGEVRFAGSTLTGATLANSPGGILRTTEGTTSFAQVNLNNPAGGQIVLNDGTVLQMSADGTYLNAGTLTLNGSYYGATLRVAGGALTLGGGGTLTFSNHGNNVLSGAAATDRLINQDNLIQGGGRLGDNSLSFTNRGVVRANVGTLLTIDPVFSGDVINAGTLEAALGATLVLQGGTFTNFEGTKLGLIQALDGSQVAFNGAILVGGQLSSTGTGRLRATGGSTLSNTTLLAGSAFNVEDGVTVGLVGALDNRGTTSLLGSYYGAGLNVGAGDVTLTGGGTIALSNYANNLIGGNSTYRLSNLDNLIQGSGNIGGNALGLTNRATIAALGSAGLTIDPGALGMLNTGTLQALGGSRLTLAGGTFTNFESAFLGSVRAEAGGVVEFVGATVSGGQLSSVDTGRLRATGGSTLSSTTLLSGSVFEVNDGINVDLVGALDNRGTIALLGSYYGAGLSLSSGNVALTGGGTIMLSNHPNNHIGATGGTYVLNNVDNVISGGGQLGANALTLTNTGTIEASQPTALTVDLAAAFTNQGTLRAIGTGGLLFNDAPLTNRGSVFVAPGSKLKVVGSLVQDATVASLFSLGTIEATQVDNQQGSMQAAGTIMGSVQSAAHFGSDSTLSITGNLTLLETSFFLIGLGGNTAGSFGHVTAASATLNGTFGVYFLGGFQNTIQSTDSFTILTGTSALTGVFPGLANGARFNTLDGFGSFAVNYDGLNVNLTGFQAVPEPATWVLLLTGAGALLLAGWRRRG